MKARENWIESRKNGATVAAGNENVSDRRDDADVGLGLDNLQSLLKGATHVVDDLSTLHASAWGNVQGRHIPANVAVTDNCENLAYGHNELQSPEPNDQMKN